LGNANQTAMIREAALTRYPFVANKNSDVYHSTDCKWSKKIKPENIIMFASNQEAVTQKFLPCRSCNPERSKTDSGGDSRAVTQKFSSYQ
jgi:methylphosphotriester-DNA--protein-cysteine methyltransferase